MRRLFDLLLSIISLIIVSPIFIVVMLILKFTGEGCVFFVQERVGEGGGRFGLLKFATMLKDSPNTGTVTAMNDPRILPAGRFLRAAKINELPQILNVVKGDMSIVGPRPLTEEAFHYYPEDVRAVIRRMKPGLTGMGTIVFRNEERILFESPKEKMACYAKDVIPLKGALEKWYYEHRSFWVDLKIVVATALAIAAPGARFYLKWFDIETLLKDSSLRAYFTN
ncbi:MAG: sugar transferase [Desulfobacterales bacterium]|jgi:lipopolysaccharide/colanic/teichoic acid biosynthesis glycosyltransferase|nr:sugar transferase [Desulfobacterales bacterium]MDY0378585.1 sugar transferase [Desulfobacterales bacterium]